MRAEAAKEDDIIGKKGAGLGKSALRWEDEEGPSGARRRGESAEEDTVGSERWSRAQKQTGASRTIAVPWKFELVKYISST